MAKPDAVFIYIGTYPCTAAACMHLRQASRVRAQAPGRAGQGVAFRGRPTGSSSARPRSTPSARQARSAVLPAGCPPRCSHSIPR